VHLPRRMNLFRRRKKIAATELAQVLAQQIAHPSKEVQRSFRVAAQKMQPRAKKDVRTITRELFYLRAYMLDSVTHQALQSEAGRCCRRHLRALLEAEPIFWNDFSLRAKAYDTAIARQEPGARPDLVIMAIFQELLGNPDPDTLLLGLRAWDQFAGTTAELRKYLRSLRIEGDAQR
jgi:hypothetical protein